ncbi:MAG: hypothetical protein IJ246_11590 [Clostridia bacterium]|nr:hypothetical protein [Clostridia bacterium]
MRLTEEEWKKGMPDDELTAEEQIRRGVRLYFLGRRTLETPESIRDFLRERMERRGVTTKEALEGLTEASRIMEAMTAASAEETRRILTMPADRPVTDGCSPEEQLENTLLHLDHHFGDAFLRHLSSMDAEHAFKDLPEMLPMKEGKMVPELMEDAEEMARWLTAWYREGFGPETDDTAGSRPWLFALTAAASLDMAGAAARTTQALQGVDNAESKRLILEGLRRTLSDIAYLLAVLLSVAILLGTPGAATIAVISAFEWCPVETLFDTALFVVFLCGTTYIGCKASEIVYGELCDTLEAVGLPMYNETAYEWVRDHWVRA